MLRRICNSRNQSAAADRNDNGVDIVKLIENLKSNSALTCDYVLVIKGMDEGVPLAVLQLKSLLISVVITALNKANLCAEALCSLNL